MRTATEGLGWTDAEGQINLLLVEVKARVVEPRIWAAIRALVKELKTARTLGRERATRICQQYLAKCR
jgi:hypothetical protein